MLRLQTFPSLYKTFVELRYAVKITDKYGEAIPPDAWYLKLLAPLFITYKSQWFQEIDQLIVFLESTPDLLTHFSCCSPSLPKGNSVLFQPYNLEPSLHIFNGELSSVFLNKSEG